MITPNFHRLKQSYLLVHQLTSRVQQQVQLQIQRPQLQQELPNHQVEVEGPGMNMGGIQRLIKFKYQKCMNSSAFDVFLNSYFYNKQNA